MVVTRVQKQAAAAAEDVGQPQADVAHGAADGAADLEHSDDLPLSPALEAAFECLHRRVDRLFERLEKVEREDGVCGDEAAPDQPVRTMGEQGARTELAAGGDERGRERKRMVRRPGGGGELDTCDCSPATPSCPANARRVDAACLKASVGSVVLHHVMLAASLTGVNLASVGRSSATAGAFTQLTNFEVNEQFDCFLSPSPRCISPGKPESNANMPSPSEEEWHDHKFRNVFFQTVYMEATSSVTVNLEEGKPRDAPPEVNTEHQEQIEEAQANSIVEAEKLAKLEVNGLMEPLSEGEQEPSPFLYVGEAPTSSSAIYLDSLVSNGTSTPSPRDDAYRKSSYVPEKNLNPECPVAHLEELDAFLKECSPIRGAPQDVQEQQGAPPSCGSPSTTPSDAISRGTSAESASPHASSSQESSSPSRGDGFPDISEPRSPVAKDLQVPDNKSLTSGEILINFAENMTTLKEHLYGLVVDYKAKQEIDATSIAGTAPRTSSKSMPGPFRLG